MPHTVDLTVSTPLRFFNAEVYWTCLAYRNSLLRTNILFFASFVCSRVLENHLYTQFWLGFNWISRNMLYRIFLLMPNWGHEKKGVGIKFVFDRVMSKLKFFFSRHSNGVRKALPFLESIWTLPLMLCYEKWWKRSLDFDSLVNRLPHQMGSNISEFLFHFGKRVAFPFPGQMIQFMGNRRKKTHLGHDHVRFLSSWCIWYGLVKTNKFISTNFFCFFFVTSAWHILV